MIKRKGDIKSIEDSSSKPKKRKKRSHSSHNDLKVRSVSELAQLVSSGAVCVPKSLVEYVDDSVQLLDQVFTILSPTDVKGMLPDILKGLKMKQVKQLCFEQLKMMDPSQISAIIQARSSQEPTCASTFAVAPLRKVGKDSPKQKSNVKLSPQHYEPKFLGTDHSSESGSDVISSPQDTSSLKCKSSDKPVDNISNTSLKSPTRVDEFIISVSDVSDEDDSIVVGEMTLNQDSMELHSTDHDRHNKSFESESDASLELDNEGGDLSDVPEAAQLLEMELRRRALESELKRVGRSTNVVEKSSVEHNLGSVHVEEQSELKSGASKDSTHSRSSGTDASDEEGTYNEVVDYSGQQENSGDDEEVIEVDFGTLLEMKLRQKALQSLLTKHKTSSQK